MYKELYENLPNIEWVNLCDPAPKGDIDKIKKELGICLPEELYEFYCESDGDGCAIFPARRIASENLDLRRIAIGLYMPLDALFFFGDNGCGDYFGYPIIAGEIEEEKIFMWNHDTDERIWVASSLESFIKIYYGEEGGSEDTLGTRM